MADKILEEQKGENAFYSDDDGESEAEEDHPLVNLQKEALQTTDSVNPAIAETQLVQESQISESVQEPAEPESQEIVVEETPEEALRREFLEKLQTQMIDQQTVVTEHRKKLQQLEKVLAAKKQEEDELGKNFFGAASNIRSIGASAPVPGTKQYSVEELERLMSALKDSLILQQNKLKFLINSASTLDKKLHCDRVCEAFFESEKTWFAALVQDIDEETQEADVAWIGYNIQERVPVTKITILAEIDQELLFEGAVCNAVYPSDGMWYEAVVERRLTDEEAEQFAAKDLRSSQLRFVVRYKSFGQKMTVPMDYIRMTKDQQMNNQKKQSKAPIMVATSTGGSTALIGGTGASAGGKQISAVTEFQFPEHLRTKASDTDKVKEQKRKKVKALKYSHKIQMQEHGSKIKQNVWLNFQKKGSKQSKGHFAHTKSAQSIFKTPDSVSGKVGVVGSGQAMTSYKAQKTKYSEAFKNLEFEPSQEPQKRSKFE